MISHSEARQLIEQSARGMSLDFQKSKIEEIDLFECVGRTLASFISATAYFPAFATSATSAMDGFAMVATLSATASSSLPVRLRWMAS